MVSSALKRCRELIEADYADSAWNVFVLLFFDGENWSDADDDTCIDLIRNGVLPRAFVGIGTFDPN